MRLARASPEARNPARLNLILNVKWNNRALEALLVDECALGRLSRGKVAELLGLSFHETEDLFRAHRVPYPAKTSDDDTRDNALLSNQP
jgi:hypothetical protein